MIAIREVAGARQRLSDPRARRAPVRADAGARAQAVRGPLRRVRRRRAAALAARGRRAHVADLRIFNPDGSEAELSGNGAREAILYLRRRGWTDSDSFSIGTAAGRRSARRITGTDTCSVDMGTREPQLAGLPRRAAGRARRAARRRRAPLALPARLDRQPPVRDPRRRPRRSWTRSTSPRSGRRSKAHALFPNRTNVSWYTPLEHGPPGAHPGADLRARRGGDAVVGHRCDRRRGRPRAARQTRSTQRRARVTRACSTAASSRSRWGRTCAST